jgi:DNA-binding CsgD family transcriptional regulator/adenylylsulfate kinase-like enzyme
MEGCGVCRIVSISVGATADDGDDEFAVDSQPMPSKTRRTATGPRGATVWFTGGGGVAGPALARALESRVLSKGAPAYVLDDLSLGLGRASILRVTAAERHANACWVARMACILADTGVIGLVSVTQAAAHSSIARRLHHEAGNPFLEVSLGCSDDGMEADSESVRAAADVLVSALHERGVLPRYPLARLAPATGVENDGVELTPREREILGLIDLGLSNKEIAADLAIRLPTVKNHVHHILEKLGAHRRGQATAIVRMSSGQAVNAGESEARRPGLA